MKTAIVSVCASLLIACAGAGARAQDTPPTEGPRPSEARVPLPEAATAYDAEGRVALSATLLTQDLAGAQDAPVRNTRVVLTNRGQSSYTYAQGWATFYDERGVRCGEGMWKLEAFAPGEQAEVDTPGLRLVCRPTTWRVVATTLLTRAGGDAAKQPAAATATTTTTSTLPPLELNIDGKTVPIQLGNPLEITVGAERIRIVLQQAP